GERKIRPPRDHHDETDRPVLSPAERTRAADCPDRPARGLDLDVAGDRVGIRHAARIDLDPHGDADAVGLVPADDLDATVHPLIHGERPSRSLHPRLANLAVPGALPPITPARATVRLPFVIPFLGTQRGGQNEKSAGDGGEIARHDELRRWTE